MERAYFLVVIVFIGAGCLYIQKNVITSPSVNLELAQNYYSMSSQAESGDIELTKEKLVATLNSLGHHHETRAEMNGVYKSTLGHVLEFIYVVIVLQVIIMVLPYVRRKNA